MKQPIKPSCSTSPCFNFANSRWEQLLGALDFSHWWTWKPGTFSRLEPPTHEAQQQPIASLKTHCYEQFIINCLLTGPGGDFTNNAALYILPLLNRSRASGLMVFINFPNQGAECAMIACYCITIMLTDIAAKGSSNINTQWQWLIYKMKGLLV